MDDQPTRVDIAELIDGKVNMRGIIDALDYEAIVFTPSKIADLLDGAVRSMSWRGATVTDRLAVLPVYVR